MDFGRLSYIGIGILLFPSGEFALNLKDPYYATARA